MYSQNVSVSRLLLKISVFYAVTSIGQRQPRRISTKLLHRLLQSQRVARTLGHLLPVQHQMPIRTHTQGELVLREQRLVVVQAEGQVVVDQILGGGADVEGVEVLVLMLQRVHFFLRNGRVGWPRPVAEDVLPDLVDHLIGSDAQRTWVCAVDAVLCSERLNDCKVKLMDVAYRAIIVRLCSRTCIWSSHSETPP